MTKTNWQDPRTGEIISPHISGLQEAVGKLEESIGIETIAETNIPLSEIFVSNNDRYRIYQAPEGKRNWLLTPTPIIKKNGIIISSDFGIDYGGGAIVFINPITASDILTADFTHTIKTENILTKQDYASKSEAEVGADNSKVMTPLRVREFFIANGGGSGGVTNVVFQSGKKYYKFTATDVVNSFEIPSELFNPTNDVIELIHGGNIPLIKDENYTLVGNLVTFIGYSLGIGDDIHCLITNTSYSYNALSDKPNLDLKQDKNNNTLNTTSKEIVGAINENKANIDGVTQQLEQKADLIDGKVKTEQLPEINSTADSITITDTSNNFASENVEGALTELFQSANNGKTAIRTALSNKGVTVSLEDTFTLLASKITTQMCKFGGTAVVTDVLSGKTFINNSGEILIGTMQNNPNVSTVLTTQGAQASIPKGYHTGNGNVTVNISNLSANNIKKGVNVGGVVGTFNGVTPIKSVQYVVDDNFSTTEKIKTINAVNENSTIMFMTALESCDSVYFGGAAVIRLISPTQVGIKALRNTSFKLMVVVIEFEPLYVKSKMAVPYNFDLGDNVLTGTTKVINYPHSVDVSKCIIAVNQSSDEAYGYNGMGVAASFTNGEEYPKFSNTGITFYKRANGYKAGVFKGEYSVLEFY